MTAGTLTSKMFKTFSEACDFAVWRVKSGNVYEFYRVEE